MNEPVAIHGVGMVGGAHSRYFREQGMDVREVDPAKDKRDVVSDVRIHFLCVPTPYKKEGTGFDLGFVHQAITALLQQVEHPVIIIKSTVLPGTTVSLQQQYPQASFLFSPEFLTEKKADEDFRRPERQIVGFVRDEDQPLCETLLAFLPPAPFTQIMPATEAELVKYFGNSFLATKVIFANLMFDFCQALGLDYDRVAEAAGHDSRIGLSHLRVNHEGYRGYGGSCFPKDVRALIQKGNELGVDAGLLKEAERLNDLYNGGQER